MRSAYGAEEIRIGGHLVTIVVDVANVMGSRPDGWWRDRAGAAARLHAEIVRLAASGRAILPDDNAGAADDPVPDRLGSSWWLRRAPPAAAGGPMAAQARPVPAAPSSGG